jgi:hypothetical protein
MTHFKFLENNKFLFFLPILFLFYSINSCTEEEFDYGNTVNAVKTGEYSNVLQSEAIVSGIVNTDNGSALTARGICYDTSNNPTIENSKTLDKATNLGDFSCVIDNLLPSTRYFARAYATNSFGTAYGSEITFITKEATIPIISSTTTANSITSTTAKSGGIITHKGASNVTSSGVCYSSTVAIPTIQDSKTTDGSVIGEFVSTLTALSPNTTYYIRAYATNTVGTAYGDVKIFSTSATTIPTGITTNDLTFITQTSSIGGGSITDDGGSAITSRGACWSNTTSNPTITNTKTIDGSGIGTFTSSLIGLTTGTTYYVRTYATNSKGTAYGPVKSFTTVAATIPTGLTTSALTSITQTTATSGGSITSDGGSTITSRGVCWSSSSTNPTITDYYSSKTNDGSGVGAFASSLTGLTANTTYYVRAYATNSAGTAYGAVRSFTTSAVTIPTGITTSAISFISQTTATSGGSVTNDGGRTIIYRGVCWSSSSMTPTITDYYSSKTSDGSDTGTFISSLTGLTANTTYYVRAYATNSAGTAYGAVITFKTLAPALAIGQSYQGGVIACLFQPGDSGYVSGQTHGLIAATSDQTTAATWGCSGTSISTSTSIGTGNNNTYNIVAGCNTVGTAAKICYDLSLGGYSDWYLPSLSELEKLYVNKDLIGGFSSSYYWSSSQYSSYAYRYDFSYGGSGYSYKTYSYKVRAVRSF